MPNKIVLSDMDLIDRLKADDETAISAIYKKYWQLLYVSAYNVLKDRQACEDMIQELFIKLWKNRAAIEISVSLKAYLYASIRYEVYRQMRSGPVRSDIFDDLPQRLQTPADYENIEYKELIAQVSSVVGTLPQKCREVYQLSRDECLTHKQIALRLNISTKTVENHLTKALRQLRTSLGSFFLLQMVMLLLKR
ncbi:RNA polymerase sigma-70 factor, ECF subfamily [Mucilaginibacter pineti]|uniref:RNA polymerase sigma-70 factor, ECF subfamily n=1 Tax=Mucilaginibacter pineti TaxID=1391627 RepID=A0A1G7KSF6_9SPHI|nr:RNA polymerase sigma-70 factor [Mucilaginibacter pineti]SDF40091.1 RNA polymerase sigma-70 factor, ECF subfamily [Mucilaginibacter pineti]